MSSDRPAWHQHSHRDRNRYVVALRGELDMGVVDDLQELLTATIAQAPLVEVDLAAVTFIDSTVIGTLISAHHRASAAGAHLGVRNATGHVHRVLDMTGVLPTLTTEPPV
jgi:anti-sigma B factor antagonist